MAATNTESRHLNLPAFQYIDNNYRKTGVDIIPGMCCIKYSQTGINFYVITAQLFGDWQICCSEVK
jgi:hypothetical protein